MTDVVWVTGTGIYHTDPDCGAITNAQNTRTVDFGILSESDYRECQHCQGDYYENYTQHVCMTCYNSLTNNGECNFCTWFDAIHNHPRDTPVHQPEHLDADQAGRPVVVADGGEPQ